MNKKQREALEEKVARKFCQDDCRHQIDMKNTEMIKEFNILTTTPWCKTCDAWQVHLDDAKEFVKKNREKWGTVKWSKPSDE